MCTTLCDLSPTVNMPIKVFFSDDPAWTLKKAERFLTSQPVLHNIILTLLHGRIANPKPGRYWIATNNMQIVGVALQSPIDFAATVTPMAHDVVAATVKAIAEAGVVLPGVNGDAATAAYFAGHWTEACSAAALPFQGQRLYEATRIQNLNGISGYLRQAKTSDHELIITWMHEFHSEIGEPHSDFSHFVDSRISSGRFWLWDDSGPAAMASYSQSVEGAVRVQSVYTPPKKRKKGYAGSCVGSLSELLIERGYRCLLYTDLGNRSSNSIYRRVGYRAVAEILRYRFK